MLIIISLSYLSSPLFPANVYAILPIEQVVSKSTCCHFTCNLFQSVSINFFFLLIVVKLNNGWGAGSGYLTAIFALLVEETGRAVGVEHIPELTEQSIENVKKSKAAHLLASGSLSLHTGG